MQTGPFVDQLHLIGTYALQWMNEWIEVRTCQSNHNGAKHIRYVVINKWNVFKTKYLKKIIKLIWMVLIIIIEACIIITIGMRAIGRRKNNNRQVVCLPIYVCTHIKQTDMTNGSITGDCHQLTCAYLNAAGVGSLKQRNDSQCWFGWWYIGL